MSTPTFRIQRTPVPDEVYAPHVCLRRRGARWGQVLRLSLGQALVAACTAVVEAPDRAVLRVEGAEVVIQTPPGLCVDPGSVDLRRAGGFLLVSDCALLAVDPVSAPVLNGVINVAVTNGGLDQDYAALETFLTGPGRAALARGAPSEAVQVLRTRRSASSLALKVEDPGPAPIPGAAPTFWRVFFMAGSRLTSATLTQFEGPGMSDVEALGWLDALVRATMAANAPPASAVTAAPGSG